ncbi:MAG TPA: FKBP-type peptidyl-prolyl cis-trans isomerase [Opitutaceae bacterium]
MSRAGNLALGVVAAAVVGAGVWWIGFKYPADQRAAAAAEEAAAAATLREQREGMFGAESVAPEVQWRETGLGYRVFSEGSGVKPMMGTKVRLMYVGRLKDGTIFDRTAKPVEFSVGQLIPGMNAALQMLGDGGKGVFFIPPALGYGNRPFGPIPAKSGLIFEIEVLKVGS